MKYVKAATLLAAGLAAFGGMMPVRAQAPAAAISIGWVDMARAFDATSAKKAGEERMNTLATQMQGRVTTLREAAFLPAAVWQEYRTLLEKEKPTAAETTRLAAIQQQIRTTDTELKTLQQTPAPNDTQKSRLNDLNGNITANSGNLRNTSVAYGQQIGKVQLDLRNQIIKELQTAAAAVAKARNVGIILNKSVSIGEDADQLLVVAGGVDLTDAVIAQANKK